MTALFGSALVPKGRENQQEETEMTSEENNGYKNLKDALQAHGITQREFAEFLGISEEAVMNKLNGETDFTYREYRKTCKFLFPGLNPDLLFTKTNISMIEVTMQIMQTLSAAYGEKVMLYASSLRTIQEEREEAEGGKHHDTGERSRQ